MDMFDEIACFAAGEFCDAELQPVWASGTHRHCPLFSAKSLSHVSIDTGVNVYDVTKRCPPEKAEIPCLPILK